MSTSAYTALNPFNFTHKLFLQTCVRKSLCTCKSCWKWCPRAPIQAWARLSLLAITFCWSAFGNSLCTYKICWKWCPRASIQAWTCLILFANTFCKSAFGKSLCTYEMCCRWCPRAEQHTSTATSILTTKSTYRIVSAQRFSEPTVVGNIYFCNSKPHNPLLITAIHPLRLLFQHR
jgi:hypothetical protein